MIADQAFSLETSGGLIAAATVVIATGPYQRPVIPELLRDHPGLFQVHASRYRDPSQLPSGAVLIVGSGASGAQIAEELLRAGRRVYLSVGRHRRMPRRYRGRDLIWWLGAMGLDQTPVEKRGTDATLPLITGAYGGHTIDFRQFAADGIVLLGRLESARDSTLNFASSLSDSLGYGDAAYHAFLDMVDAHVERSGLDLPTDPMAREALSDPPCLLQPVRQLNLRAAGIGAVIWATGYTYDFSWINLPVLNASRASNARPRRCCRSWNLFPWSSVVVEDGLFLPCRGRGRCSSPCGSHQCAISPSLTPAIAAGHLALCQCWQREDYATSATECGAGYSGNPRNPTSNSDAN